MSKKEKVDLKTLELLFKTLSEAGELNLKKFPYQEMRKNLNKLLKEYLKDLFGEKITFNRNETYAYMEAYFMGIGIEINTYDGIILTIEDEKDFLDIRSILEPVFNRITGQTPLCSYSFCTNLDTKTSFPTIEWNMYPQCRLTEIIYGWNRLDPFHQHTENFEDYYTTAMIELLGDNLFTTNGYIELYGNPTVHIDYKMQDYRTMQIQKRYPEKTKEEIEEWIKKCRTELSYNRENQ